MSNRPKPKNWIARLRIESRKDGFDTWRMDMYGLKRYLSRPATQNEIDKYVECGWMDLRCRIAIAIKAWQEGHRLKDKQT